MFLDNHSIEIPATSDKKFLEVGCLAGYEFENSKLECIECKASTYNLLPNSAGCKECDRLRIEDCKGSKIKVKQGFWRANISSDSILECNFKDNCYGGTGE